MGYKPWEQQQSVLTSIYCSGTVRLKYQWSCDHCRNINYSKLAPNAPKWRTFSFSHPAESLVMSGQHSQARGGLLELSCAGWRIELQWSSWVPSNPRTFQDSVIFAAKCWIQVSLPQRTRGRDPHQGWEMTLKSLSGIPRMEKGWRE